MRIWTLLLALGLASGALRGDNASQAAAFQASLSGNLKAASAFLAEPLAKGLGFAVGSQAFSPVQAKPLLGFNVGVGAGVGNISIDKVALKAAASSSGTDLNGLATALPDSLPVPLGSINVHLGLPKVLFFESLDFGVRVQHFEAQTSEAGSLLSGGGVELRGNVLEAALVSPVTLTLGLAYDQLKTEVSLGKALAAASGSYGASTYSGQSRYVTQVNSQLSITTLKASVSRKFLFFTPYAGLSLGMVSGETSVRSAHEGTLTFSSISDPDYVLSSAIEGQAVRSAPGFDSKVAAGFEISVAFLYLAVGGEYGLLSQGTGAHVQAGLQFR